MVRSITPRQEEILRFIDEQTRENGYPPTLREVADHFGMSSPNAVRDHLRALEEKGYLRRTAEKSRALIVTGRGGRRGYPLIGDVAAGTPVLADENHQGSVELGDWFGRDPSTFVLRVRGDSMIEAGIRDGDLVVVRAQPTVDPGDIGVAFLGSEATVKRIFFEGDRVRLQPENARLEPILVDRADPDFRLGGKVVGVVRKF
jgi:repressor LexA